MTVVLIGVSFINNNFIFHSRPSAPLRINFGGNLFFVGFVE